MNDWLRQGIEIFLVTCLAWNTHGQPMVALCKCPDCMCPNPAHPPQFGVRWPVGGQHA